jgi:anti-anti-sigma factor
MVSNPNSRFAQYRTPTHGHRFRTDTCSTWGADMGLSPEFTARSESRNGVAKIALGGELDLATTPELSHLLEANEGEGCVGIVLDLGDLAFVDCAGLGPLLAASHRAAANGHRFTMLAASPAARRLFELTGNEILLDEQEALSLLDRFDGTATNPAAPDDTLSRARV